MLAIIVLLNIIWSATNAQAYYYYVSTPMTFANAEAYCASTYNTHLATINSATYNSYAISACTAGTCWIGYNDITTENTFVWKSSSTTTYKNWLSGEPNNVGNEDCGTIRSSGGWNDLPCTSLLPFLCDPLNYYFVPSLKSWSDAEAYCLSTYSSHLATITSAAENAAALFACNQGTSCWIGYNDVSVEGTFVWQSGKTGTYTNWNSGEPNDNNNEDCTQLLTPSGLWSDLLCTTTYHFLCDLTSPTSVPTKMPTDVPTYAPTKIPTVVPTDVPTIVPTILPTTYPTASFPVTNSCLADSSTCNPVYFENQIYLRETTTGKYLSSCNNNSNPITYLTWLNEPSDASLWAINSSYVPWPYVQTHVFRNKTECVHIDDVIHLFNIKSKRYLDVNGYGITGGYAVSLASAYRRAQGSGSWAATNYTGNNNYCVNHSNKYFTSFQIKNCYTGDCLPYFTESNNFNYSNLCTINPFQSIIGKFISLTISYS